MSAARFVSAAVEVSSSTARWASSKLDRAASIVRSFEEVEAKDELAAVVVAVDAAATGWSPPNRVASSRTALVRWSLDLEEIDDAGLGCTAADLPFVRSVAFCGCNEVLSDLPVVVGLGLVGSADTA